MIDRRHFAGLAAGALSAPLLGAGKKPRVAAVVTEYRHYSHADVVDSIKYLFPVLLA